MPSPTSTTASSWRRRTSPSSMDLERLKALAQRHGAKLRPLTPEELSPARVRERVGEARAVVAGLMPYLEPAYQLPVVVSDRVPTAAVTSTGVLLFNPFFAALLSDPELEAVVAHELMHVLRGHVGERLEEAKRAYAEELRRRPHLVERLLAELPREALEGMPEEARLELAAAHTANVGFDAEVNDDLLKAGLELPAGTYLVLLSAGEEGLALPKRVLPVLPALLCDEEGRPGEAYGRRYLEVLEGEEGCRAEALSFLEDLTGESPEALRRLEEELLSQGVGLPPELLEAVRDQVARRVLEHAQGQGDVPLGLRRWAEERLGSRVDWRRLLRGLLRKGVADLSRKERPCYRVPHRRGAGFHPVVVPGHHALLPRVAVVVDASASVDEAMLGQALAEVRALARMAQVRLYSVDAAVHRVQEVFGERARIELLGDGGTDVRVGIERALRDGSGLVVVLTDGETPWPDRPLPVPVIAGLLARKGLEEPPEPPSWIRAVRIAVD